MLIPFFYTLNLLLLLSELSGIRLDSGERRFSLALVQTLLILPLLAGEYLYLACHMETQAVKVVLFSEIVFALIWLSMALRFRDATVATVRASRLNFLREMFFGAVVTAAAGYFLVYRSVVEISDSILIFHIYSPVYFSTAFIMMAVLYAAWRLEQFWRALMEITVECKSEMQVNTDPELLFSILENLLLNAFEAREKGTVVQISTGRDDDAGQAVVEIIDNGPGIAEELLPDALFEPFKTDKDGGSGIGLWQVKRVVAALGGSVLAGNMVEGGARFVVRLPLSL
ncbi:MAG: sensor histidine kinase [Dissulfuribacterales bacterium]